jgi:hypothetical protein
MHARVSLLSFSLSVNEDCDLSVDIEKKGKAYK